MARNLSIVGQLSSNSFLVQPLSQAETCCGPMVLRSVKVQRMLWSNGVPSASLPGNLILQNQSIMVVSGDEFRQTRDSVLEAPPKPSMPKPPKKLPYSAPKLEAHGSIASRTAGGSRPMMEMLMSSMMMRMAMP